MENKKDLRVIKTHKAIEKAFKELVLEKDFTDIRITELAKRAKINKKTFYDHYKNLDDLLSTIQTAINNEYIELVKDYDLIKDIDKITRTYFEFSSKQDAFYQKITCDDSYSFSNIRNKMMRNVIKKTKSNNVDEILLTFIFSSTLAIYRYWVNNGKKESLDDIILKTTGLITKGINLVQR